MGVVSLFGAFSHSDVKTFKVTPEYPAQRGIITAALVCKRLLYFKCEYSKPPSVYYIPILGLQRRNFLCTLSPHSSDKRMQERNRELVQKVDKGAEDIDYGSSCRLVQLTIPMVPIPRSLHW